MPAAGFSACDGETVKQMVRDTQQVLVPSWSGGCRGGGPNREWNLRTVTLCYSLTTTMRYPLLPHSEDGRSYEEQRDTLPCEHHSSVSNQVGRRSEQAR